MSANHRLGFYFSFMLVFSASQLHLDASSAEEKKPRVLMVTESKGYVHAPVKRPEGDLATCEIAMRQMSLETKAFSLELSQESALAITRENLERFDIVLFYTSGNLPIESANMDYFVNDWLKQTGHGFIGIHSATDTLKDDSRYVELVGGTFNSHPWTQDKTVAIVSHEPMHPTVAPFGDGIVLKEEIYQYNHWVPSNVRVLMSLDMSRCDVKRPYHVPVAWVRSWGNGRVFVNNMGHRPDTWKNKQFMDSILSGIRWTSGLTEGSTVVNPELAEAQDTKAIADCSSAGITKESLAEEAAKAKK